MLNWCVIIYGGIRSPPMAEDFTMFRKMCHASINRGGNVKALCVFPRKSRRYNSRPAVSAIFNLVQSNDNDNDYYCW